MKNTQFNAALQEYELNENTFITSVAVTTVISNVILNNNIMFYL